MKFFFLLFPFLIFSQTHRFVYEYEYQYDLSSDKFEKVNMNLDINPDEVKFYESDYAENDSLNMVRGYTSNVWNGTPVIIRKRNSNKNTNYELVDSYFSYETEDEMKWKLHEEFKTVGSYKLQKATTDFGGRKWIAWFNKEINLNEGPYKFRGLPGLIFEVEDAEKKFIFKLAKSYKIPQTYKTINFVEQHAGQKAFATSFKNIQKKQLELYNDPLKEMRESYDENMDGEFRVMNIKVTSKDQFKELTEMYQNHLRNNYNPIELDKALKYPDRK